MTRSATIGILAGMGPRSTAPFIDLIVDECQRQYAAYHDIDFPPMMIYSLPTPFRIDRPLDRNAMYKVIRAGLVRLVEADSDFVVMPCNTAHIFHRELAAAIDVPLLDIVQIAVDAVPRGATLVMPVATRFTIESGLYQQALESRGFEVAESSGVQDLVDQTITAVKESTDHSRAFRLWTELAVRISGSGAETVLLACSDLNPVARDEGLPLRLVDVTRELAVATVRTWGTGMAEDGNT